METFTLFSWCSLERPSDARAWTQAGFLAPMAAMRPRWRDLFPAAARGERCQRCAGNHA